MTIVQDQQAKIKELISKGKEQGYLTYAEVNDHLPAGIVDTDQIEDIVNMSSLAFEKFDFLILSKVKR